ncbi:hypothetical protein MRX96_029479 [Rhipicephalus microplus]
MHTRPETPIVAPRRGLRACLLRLGSALAAAVKESRFSSSESGSGVTSFRQTFNPRPSQRKVLGRSRSGSVRMARPSINAGSGRRVGSPLLFSAAPVSSH